ncbi:MAG: hypothetical protein ACOYLO_14195, partial [Ferruginibacter sp.]
KNNSGVLVKSTDYFYKQVDYTQKLYSIKVRDNLFQGILGGGPLCLKTGGFCFGSRRYVMVVSPAKSYYTLTDSIVEKTYQGNDVIKQKKTFKYNSFYQPEFVTTDNSDGTQTISYTQTPLSFDRPHVPSQGEGEAYLIEQMKLYHIYDLPIEQVAIKRTPIGDSLVTGGIYNVYDKTTLKKVYAVETNTALPFRPQFVPAFYLYNYLTLPSFNVVIDAKYKLQDSAEHYSSKLIKDIVSKTGNKSFIWDEVYNNVLAQCINASSDNIAYTSFETNITGNWSFTGSAVTDASSPTGKKTYSLSSGSISKNSLDASKTYIVSYWSKNGAQNVNGAAATNGRSLNGYTYYEHKITNPAGGTIAVTGTGTIDELRLYPEKALMTTYTYESIIGMSTQCDANNRISYYQYDASGRLTVIRDQDNNILKKICYNYAGQPENCTTACDPNLRLWQNTNTPLRCQMIGCSYTGYQEQEQIDVNSCSVPANQTRWVQVDSNSIACAVSTGVSITSQSTGISGFTAVYTKSTGQVYTFTIPAGSATLGCIPAGTYSITISKLGNAMSMIFGTGCSNMSGTIGSFKKVMVSTSNCNQINIQYDYL